MQTVEQQVLENLIKVQDIITSTPVHKDYRPKLEQAENLLDQVLDLLQPSQVKQEEASCCLNEEEAQIVPPSCVCAG